MEEVSGVAPRCEMRKARGRIDRHIRGKLSFLMGKDSIKNLDLAAKEAEDDQRG